jgi:hypothetical protein
MKMQMLLPVLLVVLSSGSVSSMNDDDVHTMLRNALHKAVPEGAAHNGKASSQFVENLAEMHGPGSTARATMLRSGFADMVPSDEDIRNVQAVKERSNPMASFASDMLASGGVGGIVGAMKDAVATGECRSCCERCERCWYVFVSRRWARRWGGGAPPYYANGPPGVGHG